ncbi:MAG: TolC family protein [Vicinamibacterales bacterium]
MRIGSKAVAVAAVACLNIGTAVAQVHTLTLPEVLARARDQAPAIISARLASDEARARLVGASRRLQTNPEVEALVGNRTAPETRFTDVEVGVGQTFEPRSRRTATIAGANAAILQSAANVDDVTRSVLRAAASAYFRTVYATERITLLAATQDLAQNVYAIADRRFRAGDIAVLDVNIARAAAARVKAEREGAEATKALALGELRQLLRLDTDLEVNGSLSRSATADLPAALQSAAQRPELRALEAAIEEADADVRLGLSFSKPEYGVGVRYAREEGDQILRGGVTVTLPLFSAGQGQRAMASARATRLRAELDAARIQARSEVRAAFDAYHRRLAAVTVLEAEAIPGLDENEQLTTRSFEVGQIGLPTLLLIRHEILETRSAHLTALLEAALAGVDLDAAAGVLR